ncbi:3-dehydro-L-gulonate 2-dehydrogenase [Treponema sp. OttesenSCG-928-L16]|nr:3-dehydro-L-gulonate 2-dehydrogenase [Treponema sp. OttesenSCG-928-L16]
MRVAYEKMYGEFKRVLIKYGMNEADAAYSAALFAEASRDGVYTHGLNRFPKFIKSVESGVVDINARAVFSGAFGVLERWDGRKGPGNLNADICMKRAVALAKEHVLGCVALSNTNHWMRPGAYGLMAAKEDCIGILWTNTVPNMPPWGGKDAKLGNNPLVIAIPNGDSPVLLDIAMSMFSYGKLEKYSREGKKLPVDGGFGPDGKVTADPAAILETHRVLPIGFWKGSGLSLVLDLIAASLSGGSTSRDIGKLPAETELSQVFIAADLSQFPDRNSIREKIEATLKDLNDSSPAEAGSPVYFPGEGMKRVREENLKNGIPVDEGIWEQVCSL